MTFPSSIASEATVMMIFLFIVFVPLILASLWRLKAAETKVLTALMGTGGKLILETFPEEAWEPTLCISTGHLTPEDAKLLEKRSEEKSKVCVDLSGDPLICDAVPFGWVVYVGCFKEDLDYGEELMEFGYSHNLVSLLKRLYDAGVVRVRFDQDGILLAQLPQFDW